MKILEKRRTRNDSGTVKFVAETRTKLEDIKTEDALRVVSP